MDGFNLHITITSSTIEVDADIDEDDELAVKLARALPVLAARAIEVHPLRDRLIAASDGGELALRLRQMEPHPDTGERRMQTSVTLGDEGVVSLWTMSEPAFVEAVNQIAAEVADDGEAA
jgi:hypothetical protein